MLAAAIPPGGDFRRSAVSFLGQARLPGHGSDSGQHHAVNAPGVRAIAVPTAINPQDVNLSPHFINLYRSELPDGGNVSPADAGVVGKIINLDTISR